LKKERKTVRVFKKEIERMRAAVRGTDEIENKTNGVWGE
jgi:hypothetical protein